MIHGVAASWESQKQNTVALGTCVAEYIASSSSLQKTLWTLRMVSALTTHYPSNGIPYTLPTTPLHVDNHSSIGVSLHQGNTKRRENIDIKHHHLIHHARHGPIQLTQTPGTHNLSNALTNSLPHPIFRKHLDKLLSASPTEKDHDPDHKSQATI